MNEQRLLNREMIRRYGCDCCLHPVYDVIHFGHGRRKDINVRLTNARIRTSLKSITVIMNIAVIWGVI